MSAYALDLVRYLANAERFLDAGGCEVCGSLISRIDVGRTCNCGRVGERDPLRRLLARPSAR